MTAPTALEIRLKQVLQDVLTAAASLLNNPPAQQFVSPGRALWPHVIEDVCDQVSVWLEGERAIYPTVDGINPVRQHSKLTHSNALLVAVEVVRCAASSRESGGPPSVALREANAATLHSDIAAMKVGLASAITLQGHCRSVVTIGAGISGSSGAPQGGMMGAIAHLIIEL